MFSQQLPTLKYFPTSRRIFQIHSFLLILFLGIWWKLRSGYLSLFPLQPGTQQCSLPGILPVCLYVHTSILAGQLPGWRCWKPGQSPQVGLALGSGMWSLHKYWESPMEILQACTKPSTWSLLSNANHNTRSKARLCWFYMACLLSLLVQSVIDFLSLLLLCHTQYCIIG